VPRVLRVKRRRASSQLFAVGVATVLAGTLMCGCAGFNKAFGQREAVVIFQEGTPASARLAVRAACSHVPHATPEPLPSDGKFSDYVNNVRYRIDTASDAQIAQLENCLNKFRWVRGVEMPQDQNS
jgi:hypothetical protein